MSLAFVPMYIKFMGMEAYGLIGMSLSLVAICSILDLGLSTTITRELARLSSQAGKGQEMRNLVRTLEIVYWAVAAIIGMLTVVIAPVLAMHWVKAEELKPEAINQAIVLMGLSISLQWPTAFYSGGLMGLQRQVVLNGVTAGMATLRGVGAILVLWLISPTVYAFFLWQAFVGLFQTGLMASVLWHSLEKGQYPARFNKEIMFEVSKFTAGVSGISILAVALTQLDKIILSRILSLEMFGYYTLAGVVTSGLYYIIGPIVSSIFPRFSQLVAANDEPGLEKLYHQSCQFLSVLILPVAFVICLFSSEILNIWTSDPTIVRETHIILSLLIIGTTLNGLMNLPYAMQLAYGITNLGLYTNLISLVLLIPLIVYMAVNFGAVGGAFVWILLNCGYFMISIQIMHRYILKGAQWRWYFVDIGVPMLSTLGIVGLGRLMLPDHLPPYVLALFLGGLLIIAILGAGLITPATNRLALQAIRRGKLSLG